MHSGETIAVAGTETRADEDALRAQIYGLLANLLSRPPSAAELEAVGRLQGGDTPLGKAIAALARVAANRDVAAVADEYQALFIGIGRGEVLPYGSYYLTGFLHEKPLAKLRNDMTALGIARVSDVSEPEDHAASVLEMMAGLIDGRFGEPKSLTSQKEFFDAHVAPWMNVFFQDLAGASTSVLYAALAEVGARFLEIETAAFAMD